MKRLWPTVAIALLALAAVTAGGDDRAEMRAAQEQARAAYEKKDYAGFLFAAAGAPIEKSALAFTLPQTDLITEGIAHDS